MSVSVYPFTTPHTIKKQVSKMKRYDNLWMFLIVNRSVSLYDFVGGRFGITCPNKEIWINSRLYTESPNECIKYETYEYDNVYMNMVM